MKKAVIIFALQTVKNILLALAASLIGNKVVTVHWTHVEHTDLYVENSD